MTTCPGCGRPFDPAQAAADHDGSLCETCEEQLSAPESSWQPRRVGEAPNTDTQQENNPCSTK